MNGRKLAAFALSGVMAVGLTACGGNGEPNESPAGGSGGEAYLVGICQLAPHDALDAATRGFKAALVEAFGEDGVKFDEQNAGGEYNNCATIVDGFVSENVDLMLANATYSLQAAQSATADIPSLGTAITNYGIALGLDSTEDKVLGGPADVRFDDIKDVDDVSEYHKAEIKHFFEQYKALEPGKEVLPGDYWTGVAKAEEEIVAARKRLEESEK